MTEELRFEATSLEEILDFRKNLLFNEISIEYPNKKDIAYNLLKSIETKLEREMEIVKKVGFDLYHVMISAA